MRVLRHARRLGGRSSALEPTEAGIAVTNQVRRWTGTHRLDHHAAVPSFDEQHGANTHVVGQQTMALQGAVIARSDSPPRFRCTLASPQLGAPAGRSSDHEPALVHADNTGRIHCTGQSQSRPHRHALLLLYEK
jgi:hypothetical protein